MDQSVLFSHKEVSELTGNKTEISPDNYRDISQWPYITLSRDRYLEKLLGLRNRREESLTIDVSIDMIGL